METYKGEVRLSALRLTRGKKGILGFLSPPFFRRGRTQASAEVRAQGSEGLEAPLGTPPLQPGLSVAPAGSLPPLLSLPRAEAAAAAAAEGAAELPLALPLLTLPAPLPVCGYRQGLEKQERVLG